MENVSLYFANQSSDPVSLDWSLVLFFKFISLISFTGAVIFGNFLVILAVATTKKLRSVNTLFITSLAVADLFVGLVVLPFSTSNEILNQRWIFGEYWCQIWLAVDVWLCTASIYNLVAISLDRYLAIIKPLQYRCLVTMSRGRISVLFVWIVSFIISSPPIFLTWPTVFGQEREPRHECSPMRNSPAYILYSAFGSFFIPMSIVVFVYAKIYTIARRSSKASYFGKLSLGKTRGGHEIPLMRVHCRSLAKTSDMTPRSERNSEKIAREESTDSAKSVQPIGSLQIPSNQKATSYQSRNHLRVSETQLRFDPSLYSRHVKSLSFAPATPDSFRSTRNSTEEIEEVSRSPRSKTITTRLFSRRQKFGSAQSRLSFELKAAKTVAVVTGCFILCWLGFSIVYALQAFPFCYNNLNCIPTPVFSVFFWLGYINSALNPVIYAVFNQKFRQAFKELLTCKRCRKEELSVVNNLVMY